MSKTVSNLKKEPAAESAPSSALDKNKQKEILTQLDIEGLDNMVANELSIYRRDFIDELSALTNDDVFIGKVGAKKFKLEKIVTDNSLKADSLNKAITKLKEELNA